MGRPDFKSGWGSEPVPGGFDPHSPPPTSARSNNASAPSRTEWRRSCESPRAAGGFARASLRREGLRRGAMSARLYARHPIARAFAPQNRCPVEYAEVNAAVDLQFEKNTSQMRGNCPMADAESKADLLVRHAARNQAGDLLLTWGQKRAAIAKQGRRRGQVRRQARVPARQRQGGRKRCSFLR